MAADENSITDRERLLACQLVAESDPDSSVAKKELRSLGWEPFLYSDNKEYFNVWQVQSFAKNNYRGLLLVNYRKKSFMLVHREMQPEPQNIANCLMIGQIEKEPLIIEDALIMCAAAVRIVNSHEGFKLYHTGFSMGGFLAQITASDCNHHLRKHNNAMAYDCPGATPFIEMRGYADNRQNVVVYLTSPNLVNTATFHYGYVRQIADYEHHIRRENIYDVSKANEFHIRLSGPSSAVFSIGVFRHTLQTHNLNELYAVLARKRALNFDFHSVQCWPKANNSFIQGSDIPSTKIDTTSDLLKETASIAFDLLIQPYMLARINPTLQALYEKSGRSFNQIKHVIQPIVIYNENDILIEPIDQYRARFEMVFRLTALFIEIVKANKPSERDALSKEVIPSSLPVTAAVERSQSRSRSSSASGGTYTFMPKPPEPKEEDHFPNTQPNSSRRRGSYGK